jgi:hypothetical protein
MLPVALLSAAVADQTAVARFCGDSSENGVMSASSAPVAYRVAVSVPEPVMVAAACRTASRDAVEMVPEPVSVRSPGGLLRPQLLARALDLDVELPPTVREDDEVRRADGAGRPHVHSRVDDQPSARPAVGLDLVVNVPLRHVARRFVNDIAAGELVALLDLKPSEP